MGRSPCCEESGLKKGPWTPDEDQKLVKYIQKHGHGSWRSLPKLAGLNRCGKSCRLRWTNYLRPDIKRGKFSQDEEQTILNLHSVLGNKWSAISSHLPGRTDNEIKNFWNTHLKKKLIQMGFDPMTHRPRTNILSSLPHLVALANLKELLIDVRIQSQAAQMANRHYLQNLLIHPQIPQLPSANSTAFNDIEISNLFNQFSSFSTSQLDSLPPLVNADSIPFSDHTPAAYDQFTVLTPSPDLLDTAAHVVAMQTCSSSCNEGEESPTVWQDLLLLDQDPLFHHID